MIVRHLGEHLSLPALLSHYRFMARTDHKSASFWRLRARVAIGEYREQSAEQHRIAA